jgi:hypothetical protein
MMDRNPRRFILTVTEVDVSLLPSGQADEVEIVFSGKVFPSTIKRLEECINNQAIFFKQKQLL